MPEEKQKKSKKFLKEKILRYKPVRFLKKNVILFSFLVLLLLTILIGVWDISRYEIYDLDGNTLTTGTEGEIELYIEENILGQNYFQLLPNVESREMYLNISRIKKVRMEKVIPNRIILFVQEHDPVYAAFLKSEICTVLSEQGVVLDTVCEEEAVECCREYAEENSLIFFESLDVEISMFDDEKDKLLVMDEIAKVVKVAQAFKYEIEETALKDSILELSEKEGRIFRFTIADNIDIQLRRFIVVVTKIKSEYMEIGTLDVRFERPVMVP